MKAIVSMFMAVLVVAATKTIAAWVGVAYEDIMLGGLTYMVFRLFTILADKEDK